MAIKDKIGIVLIKEAMKYRRELKKLRRKVKIQEYKNLLKKLKGES